MVSDAEGQAAATAAMDQSAFAHMEKLLRDETAGEYVVGKLLGRGGMAMVYLAEETRLGRKVALKVLPPELTFGHGVERFLREAKTAATLDHPHIIPIYRIASGGKLFWYAMKFLEGKSLDDVLKERGAYSLEETITILEQVADGLDYAHERKVIHRDIKPANVMLDQRDRVIITDFGIAKALTEGALTASGSVIGTPYYMSPEQGMGKPVAGAADQYSVAVMAFRMLSGHLPFDGDSAIDILHKHCMIEPPRLSESMPHLPEHVVAAVEKGMAKKAADRFPDIRSFVKAMKDPNATFKRATVKTMLIDSGELKKANVAGARAKAAQASKGTSANTDRTMLSEPVLRAVVPEPKSRVGLWLTIALLAIGGSGFGVWKIMDSKAQDLAANAAVPGATGAPTGAPAGTPTDGTQPSPGAAQPSATQPPASAPTPAPTTTAQTPPVTPPVTRQPDPVVQTPPRNTPRRQPASTPTQTTPTQTATQPPAAQPQPSTPANAPSSAPAASTTGILQLLLTPPGAVSINGEPRGERRTLVDTLRAGVLHQIKVEKAGFIPIDTTVLLPAGERVRMTLTLVARP